MKKISKLFSKLTAFILAFVIMFTVTPMEVEAAGIIEELFDISFYYFHSLNENGREKTESFYNWGSEDKEKNGIKIKKTGVDSLKVVIDADKNELYQNCKPVLMWMHKADSLFDTTKYTNINKWYSNKLEETFLLCEIPDYTQDCEIAVDVPIKLNIGLTGLINGGYYEIEFYSQDAIPEQLKFAYESQSFTLEELEEYMKYQMSDSIAEYYNADSGFRSSINGLPFRNTDYEGGGGVCAGISTLTTSKYNGYSLPETYKVDDKKYSPTSEYSWYKNVYGSDSIHDITLSANDVIKNNSPSLNMNNDGTATAYPREYFYNAFDSDEAFVSLIKYFHLENNKATLIKGNSVVKGVKLSNLQNRWSIIDYVASYLRQGKAVNVNLGDKTKGGHTIVGYRMEQIDEDTFRLYCYDSNYPDDMEMRYENNKNENSDLNEDGSYKNIVWAKRDDIYVEFTKKTITGSANLLTQKEYDVFEFDSSHTSHPTNSKNGVITFSLGKGKDGVGVFNYGSESNEIIAYKAYPVIKSDKTVEIKTFAYYKSGEIIEITNSINTTVKMDYNFIGWYKIKDSKITLTKNNYKFDNNGSKYIECIVTYDNHTDSYGSIQVRIPIS